MQEAYGTCFSTYQRKKKKKTEGITMYLVISRYIKYNLYNNSRKQVKMLNFLIVTTVKATVGSCILTVTALAYPHLVGHGCAMGFLTLNILFSQANDDNKH